MANDIVFDDKLLIIIIYLVYVIDKELLWQRAGDRQSHVIYFRQQKSIQINEIVWVNIKITAFY